jgi:hypothetical protein
MKLDSKLVRLIIGLTLTALVSSCVNITNQQKSGFLKNYEGFVDISDPDYTKVYRDENFTVDQLATMKKIYLVPFEIWMDTGPSERFTQVELIEISDYFNEQLRSKLTLAGYQLVDLVGPRTITIRGAFSAMKFEAPELSPIDFIPFRIVLNAGNYAYLQITDKSDVTTKVSLEIEFLQGLKRKQILAAISTKYVDATIANSGVDNVEVVKELLTLWADDFVKRLVELKTV